MRIFERLSPWKATMATILSMLQQVQADRAVRSKDLLSRYEEWTRQTVGVECNGSRKTPVSPEDQRKLQPKTMLAHARQENSGVRPWVKGDAINSD